MCSYAIYVWLEFEFNKVLFCSVKSTRDISDYHYHVMVMQDVFYVRLNTICSFFLSLGQTTVL